mmetsp:Transcript_7217/g.21289  ORF Transcript_7217/g.21289 Transcript_7217/m.21289 type:complete len:489 (-) Transcript_7217:554-2020(-)
MGKARRRSADTKGPRGTDEADLKAEVERLRQLVEQQSMGGTMHRCCSCIGPKTFAVLGGVLAVVLAVAISQMITVPKLKPHEAAPPAQQTPIPYTTSESSEPEIVTNALGDQLDVDCSGVRFHEGQILALKGDGVCDNGWISVNLSCSKFDWDGGDCDEDEADYFDASDNGFVQEDGDGAAERDPDEVYIPNTDTEKWLDILGQDEPSPNTVPIPPRNFSGVTDEEVEEFRQDGHILVEELLSPEEVAPFVTALRRSLEAQAEQPVGGSRADPSKAFRRTMDAFRRLPHGVHYNFTTSGRIAEVAARLLGTSGVYVYMDQLFSKYSGDHETTWHKDMPLFPFLFQGPCLSAWIPLADLDEEHGPLKFLSESHKNDKDPFQYIPYDHPQLVRDGPAALEALERNQYLDPSKDTIQMGKCALIYDAIKRQISLPDKKKEVLLGKLKILKVPTLLVVRCLYAEALRVSPVSPLQLSKRTMEPTNCALSKID